MQFGPTALDDAVGAVLAHSIRLADGRLKKGTVLDAGHIERLRSAGHRTVIAARLAADDVAEDAAAERVAAVVAGNGVRADAAATGRVNLFAGADGVCVVDSQAVAALNGIDEAVTLATLAPMQRVRAGQMVATVKIIPYAVAGDAVRAAEAGAGRPAVSVVAFEPLRVALIATKVAGDKPSVLAKRKTAVAERVNALGGAIAFERETDHDTEAVRAAVEAARAAGVDAMLVFGAVAISDRRDVIPAALTGAGGRIERLGMPVDPGNLALIGTLDDRPFVGVPSCAASPKLNGFDWILERVFAGLAVTADGVGAMGVGGLLSEIPTRPQPRAGQPADPGERATRKPRVTALVLAAGRSSRMGDRFKLVEDVQGKPIVRHVVEAAGESGADDVVVVTGHRAADVETALVGAEVRFVHNADFAEGLSASLRVGVTALAPVTDAVLVLLGDMPLIDAASIDALIAGASGR